MKKLLILMLVLGLASTANAAIVLSLNGNTAIDEITIAIDDTVVVGVYNDDGEGYDTYTDIYYHTDESYEVTNPTLTGIAGDMSEYMGFEYLPGNNCDEYQAVLANDVGTSTPGIQFTMDVKCLTTDTVLLELWDVSTLVDEATIYQVPEPMTIALLGLGGLFLRRRR